MTASQRLLWIAVTLAAATGPVRAQTREGGDIGAMSQSVKQGSLQPAPAQGLPPTPQPPASAPSTRPPGGAAVPPTPAPGASPGSAQGASPSASPVSAQGASSSSASSASPDSVPGAPSSAAQAAAPGPTPASVPPLRLSGPAQGLPPLRLSGPANKAAAYPLTPLGTPPASAAATATAAAGPPLPASKPPAPGSPAALLPPPSSYLSTAWNVWPHAWAFVPTLWTAWYRDQVQQSRPATPAERVGTEPSLVTRPSRPEATPTAPVVTTPPTRITDQEIPVLPAPRLVRRRRYNLVISGAGILAATWAADRLLANGLSPKPETWLPLVGPWILLAQQSAIAAPSAQVQVLLVVDGLLQAGGLSMALLGFVLTTKQYVVTVDPMRSDLAPREAP